MRIWVIVRIWRINKNLGLIWKNRQLTLLITIYQFFEGGSRYDLINDLDIFLKHGW